MTSTFHHHVAEVSLGPEQGLAHESAANCDNAFTLPTKLLSRRRVRLTPTKLAELDAALTIALGLD